jgi:hypothetical protein
MKDEDKTYENEFKIDIPEDRGTLDLTRQVEMLTKQKEYMQKKCREAGAAILDLEHQINELKRDNSLLAMDVATLTNRLRDAGL